jgi:hypothetical protein
VRDDEVLVPEAVATWSGGRWREGENPPDAYIDLGDRSVALEVTRLSPYSVGPDGKRHNRVTQDEWSLRLVEWLNEQLAPSLQGHPGILISVTVPIQGVKRARSEMRSWLQRMAPLLDHKWQHMPYFEGAIEARRLAEPRPSGRKVVGLVWNSGADPFIARNAEELVRDRVREKEHRLHDFPGERWLGLLNDYWLAGAETYSAVMDELNQPHGFSAVLLVERPRRVTVLSKSDGV